METSDIIVGLDIGTTKIAVIVGRKNEYGKIDILGYGKAESIGVKRGTVANIDHTVQSIQKAVEEASQRANVDINTVYAGIAGQHIKSMKHHDQLIRQKPEDEIKQIEIDDLTARAYNLALNPGEEIIDVIPQEYTLDGESGIKNPISMFGNKLEANYHIITGQTLAARNINKCVDKAGLESPILILEPIASAQAVLSEEEKEAGVVLVDIGGGTTDMAIFQEGVIRHTAVIPFGGEIITEDIKEGCSIIKRHAEELKIKFGSALGSENKDEEIVTIPGLRGRPPKEITLRNLANIIQARMEEIIDYVYYEIKNSGLEKKLIAGIVLTGGGAQLKHVAQLTSFITGMDTRIGYASEHLSNSSPEEIGAPMYATGVGLVMIGFERIEMEKQRTERTGKQTKSTKPRTGIITHLRKIFED